MKPKSMIQGLAVVGFWVAFLGGAAIAGEGSHWTYSGEAGPEHWGELSPEFGLCGTGRNQSPIDLVAGISADLPELVFDYDRPGIVEEVNTGHSIQENIELGNFLRVAGHSFELKQLHFHSPSEHMVEGESFPMEVHLVHTDEAGDLAVVGLLFEEGETNALLDRLPSFRVARGEAPYSDPIDYNQLILGRSEYYYYNGSLTTPPCSEGVLWAVLKRPIIASPAQIQHYHDLMGEDTNRPVQPPNARLILE